MRRGRTGFRGRRLDLAGLRLALGGLWFRRSTALIVLVLATVASAASVIAPLYSRAAEESIVRDTLRRADALTLAVNVSVPVSGAAELGKAADPAFAVDLVDRTLSHAAFGEPQLSLSTEVLYRPQSGDFAGGEVAGTVVQRRQALCEHLPAVQGRCPTGRDEGMVSRRSLDLLGAAIGDTVEVQLTTVPDPAAGVVPPVLRITLVGAYDPVPVQGPYWAGHPYFSSFYPFATQRGLGEAPPTSDPLFVGHGTAEAVGLQTYTIDTPVLPSKVRLTDGAELRRQTNRLTDDLTRYQLTTQSQLPATLRRADEGRELVRIAAPLAVVQLVLLSWWTLYLVVGSATEERSPELGLAKLRGLAAGQTRRFGLAETALLLLVAAPLGTLLGFAAVRGAADAVFAPGTDVSMSWTVLGTVLVALLGGVFTAALAARQVLRRPVSDLLRRVPSRRHGRPTGIVEVVVAVLAAAGLAQLVSDRGGPPSPVALLAPGMVAVAGGLLAARVLGRVARRRLARATDRGAGAALVGWAGIARRPGTARIGAVLAVATCLLLVGVEVWTVAERNRSERAAAETGAAVVLNVRAVDAGRLARTVRAADPSGRYAMAVAAVTTSTTDPAFLAVDSSRADAVLAWGAPGTGPRSVAAALRPPGLPPPLVVRGTDIAVRVVADDIESPSPFTVSARVQTPSGETRVLLGELRTGQHTYQAPLPDECPRGCRLAALGFAHPATDVKSGSATVSVEEVTVTSPGSSGKAVATGFPVPRSWRPGGPTVGGPEVSVAPGDALRVSLRAPGGPVAEVVHGSSPEPLPALVGPRAGLEVGAGAVPIGDTVGLSGRPTRFRAVERVPSVPRAGPAAVLVDLDLALQLAGDASVGLRQVWLSREDMLAERRLVDALEKADIDVTGRESSAALQRRYAGDGAVLALRLLLVCGAAAVLVAVGALLVAAYVGRRQRAYEVAALRAVGVRAGTVRAALLRENLGTVVIALACGALAAWLTTWVVLPSLPQFDDESGIVPVRYDLDLATGWAALGALAAFLVLVGLVVAALQLRAGRLDRLREGVR